MLDNILYQEYVDDDEKVILVACERANLAVEKLYHAYSMMCERVEIDLHEAELKCFEESGDMDDLISLYEEAKEEVEKKSENILTRIWKAIIEAFTRLKNFLFGTGKKIEKDEEYEVPKGILGNIKRGCKFITGVIKAAVMGIFKTIKDHAGVAGGFAAGAIGLCFFLHKKGIDDIFSKKEKEVISGKEASDAVSELDKLSNTATEAVTKISQKDNTKPEDEEARRSFIEVLKGLPGAIMHLIRKLFSKKAVKNDSDNSEPIGESGEYSNEEIDEFFNEEGLDLPLSKNDVDWIEN